MNTPQRPAFSGRRFCCLHAVLMLFAPVPVPIGQKIPVVQAVESVRIDGYGADLVPVSAVAMGPAGTIAVAQNQDKAVRFFDSTGKTLGVVGRYGQGPGEFQVIGGLGWKGDTLWVHDGSQGRVTLFSPARVVVRTFSVPSEARPRPEDARTVPAFREVYPMAVYADDVMHATLGSPSTPSTQPFGERSVSHATLTAQGVIQRMIAIYPEGESNFVIKSPRGSAGGSYPFGIEPQYAISSNGAWATLVTTVVKGGTEAVLRVTMFGANGDTVYNRDHAVSATRIPKEVADSAIMAGFQRWNRRDPSVAAAYRSTARVPPIYPPVLGIVVGNDRSLWIRLRDQAQAAQYLVLRPNGEVRGFVALPNRAEVRAADGDVCWATVRDPFDVESIVRFSVK